ncbi:DUF4192 domain-containing protein [Williamsia serinedens]|uniref:DUF4192 domain-containing protein n=1 Tax=Williamsia serinedens TaxID=391736 RepID=A0ABT1HB38_9NOCA|nr:DUF4192 domain-containing protein [Williamsia serinedens]MCP2163043.1 protein of unknown function (DUF4192) [Williamsia serinedens]
MTGRINITTVADLVAAIPALLGFIPTESMVAVAMRDGRGLFSARQDLAEITEKVAAHLAAIIARNGADQVLLVGIGAEPTAEAHAELAGHLADYGIDVTRRVHVRTCEHATEYIDYVTGETGMTRDYRDSEMTTTRAVEEGQAIRGSREEFARMFATTDAAAPVDPATIDPATIARDMADAVSRGVDPGADLAARFGALITDVKVRDAMLRLGGEQPDTAARVMARTAAHLRSDARARVLTLAMFFFYVAGDGGAAGIAADTVTEEGAEQTSLMRLLDQALTGAMPPRIITGLIPTRKDASTYLGALFPL